MISLETQKIYIINHLGLPDLTTEAKINNLAAKQTILKILQSETYEIAMQNYLELYLSIPKRILKKYLEMPIGRLNKPLKDLPVMQKILEDFHEQNIFYYQVVLGIDDEGKLIHGKEAEYVFREDKCDSEIYQEYKAKQNFYHRLNEAILKRDIAYLQTEISFLAQSQSYAWTCFYFGLSPVMSTAQKLCKKTSIT